MIGKVADAEGVFRAVAERLVRPSRLGTLAGLLALTVLVTAILNLDTAAAFMTPIMLYAGGVEGGAFLYGSVLMANAASLWLPGSNLTNLLVLGDSVSGASFFKAMWPEAVVAVLVVGGGLLVWENSRTKKGTERVRKPAHSAEKRTRFVGLGGIGVATALVLLLGDPGLPVLIAGAAIGLLAVARSEVTPTELRKAVGPLSLLSLLALATALGYLARQFAAPSLSELETTAIAAGASVLVNNLPAAALLSAHAPEHPTALLIGLNLGPNLAVTGSLSALIWWRTATGLGAKPSVVTYTKVGAPLALIAMALSLIVSG